MRLSALEPALGAGFPFSAIVGQREMKLALILAAVDSGLGGVLLRGEKGTAKSTAARSLASLLPLIRVVAGCRLGCDPEGWLCPECRARLDSLEAVLAPTPFVDLPLGASEDRLLGGLDLEAAVRRGRLEFRPGLLARAHRGVLYVDEVNLLPQHLISLILDAASYGWAQVEREGMSFCHPSSFTLVASCNPEEGPLGPQLLDRFGLCVEVRGEQDPSLRQKVLERRLAFEQDPAGFAALWEPQEEELRRQLAAARSRLAQVEVRPEARQKAAQLAFQARAQGQRGELICVRAARALAAWRGMDQVDSGLVGEVAHLALAHRSDAQFGSRPQPSVRMAPGLPAEESTSPARVMRVEHITEEKQAGQGKAGESTLYILSPGPVKPLSTRGGAKEGTSRKQAGRRRARETYGDRGRYMRASAQRLGRPLALDATFRAAAPHQKSRRSPSGPALVVRDHDIREKVRAARRGRLLLFCVDASGSMNAAARMRTTKAAVLGLLQEAYQKRDRVGLVVFGGSGAQELLPPTSSVEVARRRLAELPTGGKTPLAAGLVKLAAVLDRELAQDPKLNPLVVLLTDGRPNVPLRASALQGPAGSKGGGWGDGWGDGGYADREVLNLARRLARDRRTRFVVVDTDTGSVQEINLCRPLAQYLGGGCVSLRRLTKERVLDLVRNNW